MEICVNIEDICLFHCKIEKYFTEWTPERFATPENTLAGVHEWNKIIIMNEYISTENSIH